MVFSSNASVRTDELFTGKEAFLTSLHDMIPEGVDEITPYWDYIARQAKVLYSTNSAGN